MKDLIVQDQVRLSPTRCLAMTLAGIRFRLFRSIVTVAILALAVTFLAHGLAHSLIVHETRFLAWQRLASFRELGEWTTRLRTPDTAAAMHKRLAAGKAPFVTEYRNWASATEAEAEAAAKTARRLIELEGYFQSLPEAAQVQILAGREPIEVLRKLDDDETLATFGKSIEDSSLPPPPGGIETLKAFAAEELTALAAYVGKVQTGQRAAIARVAETLGGKPMVRWFAEGKDVAATLTGAGFHVADDAADRLKASAANEDALATVATAMEKPKVTQAMIREMRVDAKELHREAVVDYIRSDSQAAWLAKLLAEHPAENSGPPPTATDLLAAAEASRKCIRLEGIVGAETPTPREGLFDLPSGMKWLMLLSFLVCAVGVTNAMFMSVTERFTEIATLKCLGSLDGFLMLMFLFESALQGLVGAVLGIALGFAVAIGRGLLSFGTMQFAAMPVADLAICAGLALAAGMVLAVLAAVGPAWAVARLAPMEAMRID